MSDEFKNAPETARSGAKDQMKPSRAQPHYTNPPETAGTRAIPVERATRVERASEYPAFGPGDDARGRLRPIAGQHHPENPATAGEVDQRVEESHENRADLRNSPGDGGGDAPETLREPLKRSASPTESPEGEARAPRAESEPFYDSARATKSRRKAGQIDGDQGIEETQLVGETVDLRFSDPLVAEIVQLHRMRRRWLKAKNALILQGKAFGRAVCDGDKDAGTAAYERVMKGKGKPGDEALMVALVPFGAAIEHFDQSIRPIEKQLERLAKRLPVAPWVSTVRGLGWASVAAIVGEAGDLSQYPSVAGVWKRMGLAVIDGDGRQRKVANADAALIHGYNPERRSVVWNMADSLSKLQRTWRDKETGEVRKPADPYGVILEAEKAKALEKGVSPSHAENRAKRHMSKAILRDLTVEWRRAVGHSTDVTQDQVADRPEYLVAAE